MSVLMHEMLLCRAGLSQLLKPEQKQAKPLKGNGSGSNIAWETSGVFSEDDQWTSSEPEVTYTGSMTLTTAQAWGVAGRIVSCSTCGYR